MKTETGMQCQAYHSTGIVCTGCENCAAPIKREEVTYQYLNLDTRQLVSSEKELAEQIGPGGIIATFIHFPEGVLVAASMQAFIEAEAWNVAAMLATPAAQVQAQPEEALAQFTAYVVKNYPTDTVIGDPAWHAPRLFRAAQHALAQPVAGDEPYGYWRDSEWYGFSPGEDPISSVEGAKMALTPVWTHAQEVTFRCVPIPDSDDTDWVPDTPADEALLRRFADLAASPPAPREVEQARDAATELERIKQLAACGTVDSFMALPDQDKRCWFAIAFDESERRKLAEARLAFLHSTNSDAEGWEWGVARVRRRADGRIEHLWGASDHSDIDAAMSPQPADDGSQGNG